MSNEEPRLEDVLVLSDEPQIQAYLHPVRLRILEILSREKRTVSGIAKGFGVHPANLTHQVKLLERVGLIRLVERRDTGRNIEKYYRSVARSFVLQTGETPPQEKKSLALSFLRDDLAVAKGRHFTEQETVLALIRSGRVGKSDLNRFVTKLNRLVEEFAQCSGSEGEAYTMNLSLYPATSLPEQKREVRI